MKNSKYTTGDIFSVQLKNKRKKHFQYIGNDLTQLNSEVIRALKEIIHMMKHQVCLTL